MIKKHDRHDECLTLDEDETIVLCDGVQDAFAKLNGEDDFEPDSKFGKLYEMLVHERIIADQRTHDCDFSVSLTIEFRGKFTAKNGLDPDDAIQEIAGEIESEVDVAIGDLSGDQYNLVWEADKDSCYIEDSNVH
jgi:hypothetical protein